MTCVSIGLACSLIFIVNWTAVRMTDWTGYQWSGMRVSASANALKQINAVLLQKEWETLRGKNLGDSSGEQGHTSYSFHSTRIEQLGALSTDINLHDDGTLTWEGHTGVIEVKSDWKVKYRVKKKFVKFDIRDHGHVTSRVDRADVTATLSIDYSAGSPNLKLCQCSASLHGFHVHFGGGLMAEILNVLRHFFQNRIKDLLEKELCKLLDRSMGRLNNDLRTTQLIYNVKVAGEIVKLDNSMTHICINGQRLTSTHKGIFETVPVLDLDTQPEFPETFDDGVTFDISEKSLNAFLETMVVAKKLDGHSTLKDIELGNGEGTESQRISTQLVLVFLGFREEKYVGCHVGVTTSVSRVSMEIQEGKVNIYFNGRLTVTADKDDSRDELFSGILDVTLPYQVRFSNYNLNGRATGASGTFTVDTTNVGCFEVGRLQTLLGMVQLILLDNLHEMTLTEYSIRKPDHMSFTDTKVKLYPGVVRLETKVCYYGNCQETVQDEWVGEDHTSSTDGISVIDAT